MGTSLQNDELPATNWNLVFAAALADATALEEIVEKYRPMLLNHLVRNRKVPLHDAEDIVQEFLLKKVLSGRLLAQSDQHRGRFRSLLLTSLNNFLLSHRRSTFTEKRSPDRAASPEQSLDTVSRKLGARFHQPDQAWAVDLLLQSLKDMKAECNATGRIDLWIVFEERDLAEMFGAQPQTYASILKKCGYPTEKAAMNALTTSRRMLRRKVRELLTSRQGPDANHWENLQDSLSSVGPEFLDRLRMHLWDGDSDTSVKALKGPDRPFQLLGDRLSTDAGDSDLSIALKRVMENPHIVDMWECPPPLLRAIHRSIQAINSAGITLVEILKIPNPSLSLLKQIKEAAKYQIASQNGGVPKTVCTVVYYLCIARALELYDQRISTLGDLELHRGLTWILDQHWIGPPFTEITRNGIQSLKRDRAPGAICSRTGT
jgi:DNA-directed RNA polymerase specialized sigma24 family protein